MDVTIRKSLRAMACSAAFLLLSCSGSQLKESTQKKDVSVRIRLECDAFCTASTKSAYSWDESGIYNVQVFVTDTQGNVIESIFTDRQDDLEFPGIQGESYLIFAAANTGKAVDIKVIHDQESFEDAIGFDDITRNGMPMLSDGPTEVTVTGNDITVPVQMVRMMARVDLYIDRSRLAGNDKLEVRSVKIFDAARGNSYDKASENDIKSVNASHPLSLYAYENLQGTLLEGNTDPWAKVPSNIPDAADRCTFIEVKCSYESGGISCDDITYRMYPGSDNTSNFDVRRNTVYSITLIPTEDEIHGKRGSWKIESGDWTGSIPVSICFDETYKEIYVDGPYADGEDIWKPSLTVFYSDGTEHTVEAVLSSNDSRTAAVSGQYVYGKSIGTAIISASYTESGFTVVTEKDATVKVTDPLLYIAIEPEELVMEPGESFDDWLVIKTYPSGDYELRWNYLAYIVKQAEWEISGSEDFILDVSSKAVTVTCSENAEGDSQAVLRVTVEEEDSECFAECSISVNYSEPPAPPDPPEPERITVTQYRLSVTPGSLSLADGESAELTGWLQSRTGTRFEDEDDGQITDWSSWSSPGEDVTCSPYMSWISSDEGTVKVEMGVVTAGNISGTARVTATYTTDEEECSDYCDVTVSVRDIITRRIEVCPGHAVLEEGGEPVQFKALLITTTNGVDDSGVDITSNADWETLSGGQYITDNGAGLYQWKDGPGESRIRISYGSGEDAVESEVTVSTTAPISLVSFYAEPEEIILNQDNGWSAEYRFFAIYSNGVTIGIDTYNGLSISYPGFVDEANGILTAKAAGEGYMTGSYTFRGVTMSASTKVTSIEEWFTIGLQFHCSRNGSVYTISKVEAVKMSQFSGPDDTRYILLHSGEFTYSVTGNIAVREDGDGFIVTAHPSDAGMLTITYHCPVLDEDVSDDIIFENGYCSHISD